MMILDLNLKLEPKDKEIIINALSTNIIKTSDDVFTFVNAQLTKCKREISFVRFHLIIVYIHLLLNIDLPEGKIADFTDYCETPFKNLPTYQTR